MNEHGWIEVVGGAIAPRLTISKQPPGRTHSACVPGKLSVYICNSMWCMVNQNCVEPPFVSYCKAKASETAMLADVIMMHS